MILTEGKLRIQSSFSAKLGQPNFSSMDKSAGLSIEYTIPEGTDLEAAIDEALKIEARITTDMKLVVASALGLELKDVDGTDLPDFGVQKAAAPKGRAKSSGGRQASGGGSGRGGFKNKTFQVTIDGDEYEVADNRKLIESGKFSSKSPSFKLIDAEIEGSDGVWEFTKDGDPNPVWDQIVEQLGE